MSMSENEKYTFCPKCGALAKDGVCQSCGVVSTLPETKAQMEKNEDANVNPVNGQQPIPQEPLKATTTMEPTIHPNKKKSKKTAWIIFVILALLVTAMVFVVSNLVKTAIQEAKGVLDMNQIQDYFAQIQSENQDDSEIWQSDEEEQTETEGYTTDETYIPSPDDEYYIYLSDAIDESLDYSVDWEDYQYADEEKGIDVYIVYPQLTGDDIPNLDNLNDEIKSASMYYVDFYQEQYADADIQTYQAYVTAYVTYTSDKSISIVLSEDLTSDDYSTTDLYCMNIDLLTGQFIDNEDWLDFSSDLAKEFRKQSDYQNGTIDALDALSDEEILDYLSDDASCIAFYTPVGLEIGFNYTTNESGGWVTATIKDYEKYLKKI